MKSVRICKGSWASFQVVILSSDRMSTIHMSEVPCGMPPCSVTRMQRLTVGGPAARVSRTTCELNIVQSLHIIPQYIHSYIIMQYQTVMYINGLMTAYETGLSRHLELHPGRLRRGVCGGRVPSCMARWNPPGALGSHRSGAGGVLRPTSHNFSGFIHCLILFIHFISFYTIYNVYTVLYRLYRLYTVCTLLHQVTLCDTACENNTW